MKSKHYKDICRKALSLTCIHKIVRRLKRFGYGGSSIEDFAHLLPTTRSLRMRSFIDEKYFLKINRQYWKRINEGDRTIGDTDLIRRIETGIGVKMSIGDNPLFQILSNNIINRAQLLTIFEKIKDNLGDRVFFTSNGEIQDKQVYWSHKNIDLVSDENFLAYQLLLLNRNWNNENTCSPYIKDIVLLFWRVLMRIPMGKVSEPLCEVFFNYLIINLDLKVSSHEKANHFVKLRNLAFPETSQYPYYTNSLESYVSYHQIVYEKYSLAIKYEFLDYIDEIKHPIIYWADRYAHRWMTGEIDKADLFDHSSPEFSEIYRGARCLTRHRIW